MARVTQKQLQGVRKAIAKLDAGSMKVAEEIIRKVGLSDADRLYKALMEGLAPVCRTASIIASQLGASCYNTWRLAGLGESIETVTAPAYTDETFSAAVGAAVGKASKGGTVEQVMAILNSRIGYNSRASYSETLFANAKRDTVKPRFARVPDGTETCDFCLMLASNGFYYYGKMSGESVHNHANCQCVYVCSWDKDPRVEGFDKKEAYDRWQASIKETAEARAEKNGTTVDEEKQRIMSYYRNSAKNAKKRTK